MESDQASNQNRSFQKIQFRTEDHVKDDNKHTISKIQEILKDKKPISLTNYKENKREEDTETKRKLKDIGLLQWFSNQDSVLPMQGPG